MKKTTISRHDKAIPIVFISGAYNSIFEPTAIAVGLDGQPLSPMHGQPIATTLQAGNKIECKEIVNGIYTGDLTYGASVLYAGVGDSVIVGIDSTLPDVKYRVYAVRVQIGGQNASYEETTAYINLSGAAISGDETRALVLERGAREEENAYTWALSNNQSANDIEFAATDGPILCTIPEKCTCLVVERYTE